MVQIVFINLVCCLFGMLDNTKIRFFNLSIFHLTCTTDKESRQTEFEGCDVTECRFRNGCPLHAAQGKKIVHVCILYCCDHKSVVVEIECILTCMYNI